MLRHARTPWKGYLLPFAASNLIARKVPAGPLAFGASVSLAGPFLGDTAMPRIPSRCAALRCLAVDDAEGVQGAWRTGACEQGDARGSAER